MRPDVLIETPRLLLRQWRDGDLEPFARLNADHRVMEFFPARLSREESDRTAAAIRDAMSARDWGLYAAELRDSGDFIGYIGLAAPRFEAHFTPCVEIGWRLACEHWNRGLATEGARAVLHHAFTRLDLREVVSFTTAANVRSRRVMEKIGMLRDANGDFDHPAIEPGDSLRRHVLYRIRREGD